MKSMQAFTLRICFFTILIIKTTQGAMTISAPPGGQANSSPSDIPAMSAAVPAFNPTSITSSTSTISNNNSNTPAETAPSITPPPSPSATSTTNTASTSSTPPPLQATPIDSTNTSTTNSSVAPANTPTTSSSSVAPVPTSPEKPKPQVLTSIYIQNNFNKDAELTQIEILLANQSIPFKKNVNIKIPAVRSLYSKGTVTAFDLTTENNIDTFNGITSITINNDLITFKNAKTGFSLKHPIAITKKGEHWILDEQ